jgi:hypothetical protein
MSAFQRSAFLLVILKNNQRKLLHLVQNSLNQMRSSAN